MPSKRDAHDRAQAGLVVHAGGLVAMLGGFVTQKVTEFGPETGFGVVDAAEAASDAALYTTGGLAMAAGTGAAIVGRIYQLYWHRQKDAPERRPGIDSRAQHVLAGTRAVQYELDGNPDWELDTLKFETSDRSEAGELVHFGWSERKGRRTHDARVDPSSGEVVRASSFPHSGKRTPPTDLRSLTEALQHELPVAYEAVSRGYQALEQSRMGIAGPKTPGTVKGTAQRMLRKLGDRAAGRPGTETQRD